MSAICAWLSVISLSTTNAFTGSCGIPPSRVNAPVLAGIICGVSVGTLPPPPPPPTSVCNILRTLAKPPAITAAPVTKPKVPPCLNATLAPAYVSITACATA